MEYNDHHAVASVQYILYAGGGGGGGIVSNAEGDRP